MTTDPGTDCSEALASEAAVAGYLAAHPEFFNHHPALLAGLQLPHATGQTVSLWDRQIALLRQDVAQLREQLQAFIVNARHNDDLMQRMHRLILALVEARDPSAAIGCLQQAFVQDFDADRATLLVFAEAVTDDCQAFVGVDSPRRTPFADLLAHGETLCGRLTQAQRAALFEAEAVTGSHVVLPMTAGRWQGLLVASSADPQRFEPGMGTEFLAFLRDVLLRLLDRWVAPA